MKLTPIKISILFLTLCFGFSMQSTTPEFAPPIKPILIDQDGKTWFSVFGIGLYSRPNHTSKEMQVINDIKGNVLSVHTLNDGKNITSIGDSIHHSSDYGQTWKEIDLEFEIYPNVFAWHGEIGVMGSTVHKKIAITENQGHSWKLIELPARLGITVEHLVVRGMNIWVLLDGSRSHYSSDLGETWQEAILTKNKAAYFNSIAYYNDTIIFGIQEGKIFKSNNAGQSWTLVADSKLPLKNISVVNETEFIAFTPKRKAYYSTNSGNSWEKIKAPYRFPLFYSGQRMQPILQYKYENGYLIAINYKDCVAIKKWPEKDKWHKSCPLKTIDLL